MRSGAGPVRIDAMSSPLQNPSARAVFPFAAIVGQDLMKQALILNTVSPAIGGVLIRGEKGTAKSTAVRGLTRLFPMLEAADCTYGCDLSSSNVCPDCGQSLRNGAPPATSRRRMRVVDLPASATEDRLVGTLDLHAALKEGDRRYQPGLLAQAHRGILYVDEVNLLDDHLVDTLLDAAAMGVNYVEREGLSYQHPSEFILVGTMNPEEGELRPQLMDRFGLAVEVRSSREPDERVAIMKRRAAFESDPEGFLDEWEAESADIATRIEAAKAILAEVKVADQMLRLISRIAIDLGVDGHRADLVMYRTGAAIAAYDGRTSVSKDDIMRAAELALSHRRRGGQTPPNGPDGQDLESAIRSVVDDTEIQASSSNLSGDNGVDAPTGDRAGYERIEPPDPVQGVSNLTSNARSSTTAARPGRRMAAESTTGRGRWTRSRRMKPGDLPDVAIADTLLAAAVRGELRMAVDIEDIRIKRRVSKHGSLIVCVVDASGSMGAERRIRAAKSLAISLLQDAYVRRDRVCVVAFRGANAEVVVPPTRSPLLARRLLEHMPSGGQTPLAHGLELTANILEAEKLKDPHVQPIVIVISDGRANVPLPGGTDPSADAIGAAERLARHGVLGLVVDASVRRPVLSVLPEVCSRLHARYVRIDTMLGGSSMGVIRLSAGT